MQIIGDRILCKADPRQNVRDFAEELIMLKKSITTGVIGIFNDIPIDIKPHMTADDVVKKYLDLRM